MRKVFLSVMMLSPINKEDPTYYTSEDFKLSDKKYDLPLSYIIEDNVDNNDKNEIVIITAVQQGENGEKNVAEINYEIFQNEVSSILSAKNVEFKFITISLTAKFDSLTFNRFFKKVAYLIENDDKLYADITFGMKPYSFSMFIAIAYAAKAAENVDVDTVIYAQKYSGRFGRRTPDIIAADPFKSRIYDLTGLFYLNAIASYSKAGKKQELDKLLGLIIDED